MTKQFKANVSTRIAPVVHNVGDERTESPLIVTCLPKELKVEKASGWNRALELSRYRRFGSSWTKTIDFLNVDAYKGLGSMIIVAKQTGTYKIFIEVKDRSGKSEHELILEVS